ncbi:MAG TPA: hypothetical protein VFX76_02740, partial [Roseiflexaceae bacterium]|nr:hypothetical protein [Roseiflexaceae bacterium]
MSAVGPHAKKRPRHSKLSLSIGLACGAFLLVGCAETPSALSPAGPAAERIATLWWVMLGVAAAIYLLVLALLYLALRRKREPDPESIKHPADGRRFIVGGGVIMPVLVLLG